MVKYQLSCMINVMTFLLLKYACQTFIATFHHGTVMSKILRTARSSSSIISFYEKASALITRLEKQGGNR